MAAVDLIAVQPLVGLADYASEHAFAAHHRRLAARAAALRRGGGVPALAVWPEMVGTFLAVADHLGAVGDATTTDVALRRVALRVAPALLRTMLRGRTTSTTRAFLAAVAPQVWERMHRTFADIARDHDLWVVSGSALLPRNALGDRSPVFAPLRGPDGARVFNTSFTFAPDGRCVGVTRKVNLVPTQEDVLDLSAGDVADLGVVPTPFGPLGTLICYDGFAEPHTNTEREPGWTRCLPVLDRLGAAVVAQPSANAWPWDSPWFFNDTARGEHQLRSEQWFAEGSAAELPQAVSIRWVVNPQLVGQVLDNTFEAPSLILERTPDGVAVRARAADPRAEDILVVAADG